MAYELTLRKRLSEDKSIDKKEETKEANPKFGDFAWEWFCMYVEDNNKPSEVETKKRILKKHLIPFFGNMNINEINGFEIEKYKKRKRMSGLSKKTINNHLAILGTSLNMAHEWGKTTKNIKIKRYKVFSGKSDFLTEDELQILLNHAKDVWRDMILLAARTGLRRGELIGLRWEDINFNNATLTVQRAIVRNVEGSPKGNKTRNIPLINEVFLMLWKNKKQKGYVFQTRPDHHLSDSFCNLNMKKICEKAGLRNIGWHTLRHTFASHLFQKNAPTKAVQELMGHVDIQTTLRYAHLGPSNLQSAISVLEPNSQNFGQQAVNSLPEI